MTIPNAVELIARHTELTGRSCLSVSALDALIKAGKVREHIPGVYILIDKSKVGKEFLVTLVWNDNVNIEVVKASISSMSISRLNADIKNILGL